jgi:hypothetical protein
VEHAGGVGRLEAVGHLQRHPQRLAGRQRAAPQPRRQGLAAEQLHDQVGGALVDARVVERHHVGVVEPRRRLGLLLERLGQLLQRPGPPRPDGLEGHGAGQLAVHGLEDQPEAAAPQLAQQLEAPGHHVARPQLGQQLLRGARGRLGQLGEQRRDRGGGLAA